MISIKKASFGFRFFLGLALVTLFLFAYETGENSISYTLTGFSIRQIMVEDSGILQTTLILGITMYFILIVLAEVSKKIHKKNSKKQEKSVYDHIRDT